jgi:hypothetical protein
MQNFFEAVSDVETRATVMKLYIPLTLTLSRKGRGYLKKSPLP